MGLKEHFGRAGQAKEALLALPLVLVGLAAAFAAIEGNTTSAGPSHLSAGYPIRIDLAEVAQITARKSLSVHAELTAGLPPPLAQVSDPLVEASDLMGQASDLLVQTSDSLAQNPALPSRAAEAELGSSTSFPSPPADLGVASPLAAMIGSRGPIPVGVIAIDYDLAGGPRSASALQVRKEVQQDGRIVGRIEIRIDNNSAIYVARSDLVQLIPSARSETSGPQEEFIRLTDLRESGINLRYDPVTDLLVLRE